MIGKGMALSHVADQIGMPSVRAIMNWLSRYGASGGLASNCFTAPH